MGCYFSLVDLGQFVTVPLVGETTSDSAGNPVTASTGGQLDPVQLLAPGFYLRWGIDESPFVLFGGVGYGPKLRNFRSTMEAPEVPDERRDVLRFGGGLAVDVTILPF